LHVPGLKSPAAEICKPHSPMARKSQRHRAQRAARRIFTAETGENSGVRGFPHPSTSFLAALSLGVFFKV